MKTKMNLTLHIGLDDTDSILGGCTTYIGALIIEELLLRGNIRFLDYPNLIRLNPNIPWKTRGNGAVAIRIRTNEEEVDNIKKTVIRKVVKYSEMHRKGTEPAIAILKGKIPDAVKTLTKKALTQVVPIKNAEKVAEKNKIELITFNGKRGIVGAIGAIGEPLTKDYTYELLTYRISKNYGTERKIERESVYKMDLKMTSDTFGNIDPETGRILITPRGPDPVLYGIRGENPKVLLKAKSMIKANEPIDRWTIYRTNQGTDAHLRKIKKIREIKPYDSIGIRGIVDTLPIVIKGGHVIFKITDGSCSIDCAVFKPTGKMTEIASRLMPGDIIEIFGGAKPNKGNSLTINIEKLRILKLTIKNQMVNPKCPKCGTTMKSEGKNKGFQCPKCKYRANVKKNLKVVPRKILEGLYIPPPRAHRHLTKPSIRYGKEKTRRPRKMIEQWYWSKKITKMPIRES